MIMEQISIYDLIAMYDCVSHKLGGIKINDVQITWNQWLQSATLCDVDQIVQYMLDPVTRMIHVEFPGFDSPLSLS